MNTDKIRACLLAGGKGVRMKNLGGERPKPLIPYGGKCNLIDFSLHNLRENRFKEVLLLPQFNEGMLLNYMIDQWCDDKFHVHFGHHECAHKIGVREALETVPRPQERGTADALIKNKEYIFCDEYDDIIILHSDHVYLFDYEPMIKYHQQTGAALTIGHQKIDIKYVHLFGMVDLDENNNVTRFVEKCPNPTSDTVFTAVCIFKKDVLWDYLQKLSKTDWKRDISHDVIPAMIQAGETVKSFLFENHWEDIGTVERYIKSNMDLLAHSMLDFDNIPHTIANNHKVLRESLDNGQTTSIYSSGSTINGMVSNSIIYPDVFVDKDAKIINSIIMPGARITGKCNIENSVITDYDEINNSDIFDNHMEW